MPLRDVGSHGFGAVGVPLYTALVVPDVEVVGPYGDLFAGVQVLDQRVDIFRHGLVAQIAVLIDRMQHLHHRDEPGHRPRGLTRN